MSQLNMIISTLKQELKSRGKTYADIAKYIKVSESSVKRLFMNKSISVARLEKVCHFIGLELTDLIARVDKRIQRIAQLGYEQEQHLVSDEKLLLLTIAVLNGWDFTEIIQYYDFTDNECYQYLCVLDKLNVIELLPFNKFKVLVAQDFSWISNGPIEKFFHKHMRKEFFSCNFSADNEFFLCLNGMLSESNNQLLQKKLRQVKELFAELHQNSLSAGINQAAGSALILALRPWAPALFERYKRPSSS